MERQEEALAQLRLSLDRNWFPGSILLWILLFLAGWRLLDLGIGRASGEALVGVMLHWLTTLVHYSGHAVASSATGHPMSGIRLGRYLFFGLSEYPADEGPLPAAVHRRRALGGPTASLLWGLLAAVATVLLPGGGLLYRAALFTTLDSLAVFTIGALMPLGFTDGSTLLSLRGEP